MTLKTIHPTLRDMIALEIPGQLKISPQGTKIAYLVRKTNWNTNRYEYQAYLYSVKDKKTTQLTRTGNISQLEWVDEETLAVLKAKGEEKNQVFLFENLVGEGFQVTDHKSGVQQFWAFGDGVVFLASDPDREERKPRSEQFGKFTHFEQESSPSALYYTSIPALKQYESELRTFSEEEAKKRTKPVIELSKLLAKPLKIENAVVSPAGDALYLNCRERDDLVYLKETRVFQIRLDPKTALQSYLEREQAKNDKKKGNDAKDENDTPKKEDLSYLGEIRELPLPRTARVTAVSPDGEKLLVSFSGRDDKMYTREDAWVISVEDLLGSPEPETTRKKLKNISEELDQTLLSTEWIPGGVFCSFPDGTHLKMAYLSEDTAPEVLDFNGMYIVTQPSVAKTGQIAIVGANETSFPEVYFCSKDGNPAWQLQKITGFGKQVESWATGTRETIRWQSKDAAEIEGVLYKPADFDPQKKYPLVFVVHGGPSWLSVAYLLSGEDLAYYPSLQFLNRDILILKPNYRGSIGRGQAFMELNKDNLGVGDLWDLESAIDHLAAQGFVDPEKVGCMGWSQGGYISAFAGLQSSKFAAVSVGAGISDWYTYHISNDIPMFTTDYLSASPFRDRAIYEKTAPIANLKNAKTPMLIQHGTDDQRVPVSNATELYRGLKEMGVPVELFLYPGMAHPITKPRENHAVMQQNLAWFCHWLLGEELEWVPEKNHPNATE